MASVTKGLTALAVGSLIQAGRLGFDTSVRTLLDDDLRTIDPSVTIEHLLAHTSGVGDYIDEDEPSGDDDYDLEWPMRKLNTPRDYLPLLDLPQETAPGSCFKYNNSGYVILSIVVEAVTGRSFFDVVQHSVLDRAGMTDTGFFRTDDLPSRAAVGYLTDGRTNIFHLPVRGAGDGGVYSTIGDMERLWIALFEGRILDEHLVRRMTHPRSDGAQGRNRYSLGFWIRADRPIVMLEGADRGVSARSAYDPESRTIYSVISNTMRGAWSIVSYLDSHLDQPGS